MTKKIKTRLVHPKPPEHKPKKGEPEKDVPKKSAVFSTRRDALKILREFWEE